MFQTLSLWNSNASGSLKNEELPTNVNVVTGKWARSWETDGRRNVVNSKARMVATGLGHIHNVEFSLLLPQ